MSDQPFPGFQPPVENWSKLPHQLIDEFSNISSVSELKVILYILRHTWGYNDEDKRITNDEFCNGRRRKDGTRIDGGCHLSPKSVRSGLSDAVAHGYISIEEDASDLARIKRWYSLRLGGENVTPGGEKVTPRGVKSNPRTEKETRERNLGEETAPPVAPQPKTEPVSAPVSAPAVAPYPALGEFGNTGTAGQWANARGQRIASAPGYKKEMKPVMAALLTAHHIQTAALDDSDLRTKWMRQTVRFHEAGLTDAAAVEALSRRWYTEHPFGQKGQPPLALSDQLLNLHYSKKNTTPAAAEENPPAFQVVFTDDDEWRA